MLKHENHGFLFNEHVTQNILEHCFNDLAVGGRERSPHFYV